VSSCDNESWDAAFYYMKGSPKHVEIERLLRRFA
jgi:hypothetical protein